MYKITKYGIFSYNWIKQTQECSLRSPVTDPWTALQIFIGWSPARIESGAPACPALLPPLTGTLDSKDVPASGIHCLLPEVSATVARPHAQTIPRGSLLSWEHVDSSLRWFSRACPVTFPYAQSLTASSQHIYPNGTSLLLSSQSRTPKLGSALPHFLCKSISLNNYSILFFHIKMQDKGSAEK